MSLCGGSDPFSNRTWVVLEEVGGGRLSTWEFARQNSALVRVIGSGGSPAGFPPVCSKPPMIHGENAPGGSDRARQAYLGSPGWDRSINGDIV